MGGLGFVEKVLVKLRGREAKIKNSVVDLLTCLHMCTLNDLKVTKL